jgi:hypothetical protein
MTAFSFARSVKTSAWRRSSSAIIGGLLRSVDTTGDTNSTALQGFDQRAKIAVTGKQHDVIDMFCHPKGVNYEFDAHASLELAASLAIVELFCWFRNDGEAIVCKPIGQRPQ